MLSSKSRLGHGSIIPYWNN